MLIVESESVDEIAAKIIKLLKEESRLTHNQIAEKLGYSPVGQRFNGAMAILLIDSVNELVVYELK